MYPDRVNPTALQWDCPSVGKELEAHSLNAEIRRKAKTSGGNSDPEIWGEHVHRETGHSRNQGV